MSLKLIDIKCIIDNCIQEEKHIGIIADIELTSVIEDLLDDMELVEKYNVLCLASKIKATGEYLIMINCKDNQYHYYILDYKLNENISVQFDELHIVSDNSFNTFNPRTVRCDAYSFSPSITICTEEVDALYDCNDIDEEDYEEQITHTDAKWKCPVCCYTCPQEECEYQGDLDECDCDDCLDKKEEDDDTFTFETDVMMPVEKCSCENCQFDEEDKLIEYFTQEILSTQGCPECIEDLVEDIFEIAKKMGWDNHREYIRECNED